MTMSVIRGGAFFSEVSGSTCTEGKFGRCGSADGWRVNGLEVHAGIPRSEREATKKKIRIKPRWGGPKPTPPLSVEEKEKLAKKTKTQKKKRNAGGRSRGRGGGGKGAG